MNFFLGIESRQVSSETPSEHNKREEEIKTLLDNQHNILDILREISSVMVAVKSKVDPTDNNNAHNTGQVKMLVLVVSSKSTALMNCVNLIITHFLQIKPLAIDHQSYIAEIRDGLNVLKNDILQTNVKITNIGSTCSKDNCVTTTVFLIFSILQITFILGYNFYR